MGNNPEIHRSFDYLLCWNFEHLELHRKGICDIKYDNNWDIDLQSNYRILNDQKNNVWIDRKAYLKR